MEAPAIESLEYPPYCPDGEVAAPASYTVRLPSKGELLSVCQSHTDITHHTTQQTDTLHTPQHIHIPHNIDTTPHTHTHTPLSPFIFPYLRR